MCIFSFLFSFNVVSTYAANIEEIYQSFRKDKHHTSQNRSKSFIVNL